MTEQELRSLVRDAVARHLHHTGGPACESGSPSHAMTAAPAPALLPASQSLFESAHTHVSHARYIALVNASGACLIEPAVACNHCGFCQTHGN